jgi:hypothetical protein
MKWIRILLAAAAYVFAFNAAATPQTHDANDLWIVPEESGWGLNLFHQGDTLFGSLFVYGPDGRARWYTASSLVGDDGGQLHDHPNIYTGPLYESTGPAIGGSFDPSRVTRRQVGMMTIELATEKPSGIGSLRNYANVYYSVDGVQVQKKAYPFSFVAMGLTGTYVGYTQLPGAAKVDTTFNVSLSGGSFSMSTTATSASCNYSGTQEPSGSLFAVEGTYTCSDGRAGNFTLAQVDVTRHGFTAQGSLGDIAAQRTSGAIRGDGYQTDLWWVPSENGWGLNIIEQGDVLFGTLFVYDANGQPHWYSASDLAYQPCAPADAASDCNGIYRGALYESTGPYFGTSFNAAAVTRRQVGTMTFESFGLDSAQLDYTIDGVTAHKQLSRAAFRANSLVGTYVGHMIPSAGASSRGTLTGPMDIAIIEFGTDSIRITMQTSSATCTVNGTRSQFGRQGMASGPYTCGARLGEMSFTDIYVTWSGFTAFYSLDGNLIGRIDATRTNPH